MVACAWNTVQSKMVKHSKEHRENWDLASCQEKYCLLIRKIQTFQLAFTKHPQKTTSENRRGYSSATPYKEVQWEFRVGLGFQGAIL